VNVPKTARKQMLNTSCNTEIRQQQKRREDGRKKCEDGK
jgi:hypothetical protein